MGIVQETENNAPMLPMETLPGTSQSDPPPYAYQPLTPSEIATSPEPPMLGAKTVLVPPPSESVLSSSIPPTPAASDAPVRVLDSRDPLSTCDAKFADLVLTYVIIPRLRVGVLRWKDRETLEYVPRTKEDRKQRIRRSKYDEELGFLVSEYKFRLRSVEDVLTKELEKAGFKVKNMKLKEDDKKGIVVKWSLKQNKGQRVIGSRQRSGGCCGPA